MANDLRGRLDEHLEPLLGTEPTGRADDTVAIRELWEEPPQVPAIAGVGLPEGGEPGRIADHLDARSRHPRPPDLAGLPLRDADHAVHEAQMEAVERLVEAHLQV